MTREGGQGDVSGEARAFAPGAAPTKVRPRNPRKVESVLMTRHGISIPDGFDESVGNWQLLRRDCKM